MIQAVRRESNEEIVKLARKQVDAFNTGDWEQMRAMLASDSCHEELGTQRKIEGHCGR
jgi:hypothetical protein